MRPSIGRRVLKGTQGTGYMLLTAGAGLTTVFLATATCGLAMTGIGIPLAIITGAGTAGTGYGTIYFAKRTGHKFIRSAEQGRHSNEGRCSHAPQTQSLWNNHGLPATSENNEERKEDNPPHHTKALFSDPKTSTSPSPPESPTLAA